MSAERPSRPVHDLPRTPVDRAVEALALAGLLLLLALPLVMWSDLPDRVPMHFNASGDPDGWAPRWTVFLLPVVGATLYAGLSIMSRYPHRINYPWKITEENARAQYRITRSMVLWLKAGIVGLFAFVEWRIIQTARGEANGLGVLFLPLYLSLIFGAIGFFMYRAYKAR